ncbi:LOW QUALITY PROTEIN: hypothetical protein U9M48_035761, partial [Paspalum notatum var. saurae]
MDQTGRPVCSLLNSPTTTVTRPALKCRLSRPCMDASAELHMWEEAGERQFIGPAMFVEAAENVAKSRQKSYADKRRWELTFEEGEFVYLKVSPLRGTKRFHTRVKLAPRYIGPFRIVKKVGDLAYELELPKHLSGVHPVFHLRKCLRLPEDQISLEVADLTTWNTWNTQCRFLIEMRKAQEEQGLQFAKCYGATTPKEKLLRKRCRICGRCFHTSSRT